VNKLAGPGKVRSEWPSGSAAIHCDHGSADANLKIRSPHRPSYGAGFFVQQTFQFAAWLRKDRFKVNAMIGDDISKLESLLKSCLWTCANAI
jgi:hypothetical protein